MKGLKTANLALRKLFKKGAEGRGFKRGQHAPLACPKGAARGLALDYARCISATQVGSILGFDPYKTDRELYRDKIGVKRRAKRVTSEAAEHGLKFEDKAIQLFLARHGGLSGFTPDYLVTREEPFIGGKGDHIYTDRDGHHLLEIKCLYTRSITKTVPMNYWLQVQTMLYVYRQLGLPVRDAVYCENRFSSETGNLLEHWEHRVTYDASYFEGTVLPALSMFSRLTHKKRTRPDATSEPVVQSKRRCGPHRIISRVNVDNLYGNFLETSHTHGPECLKNHVTNDHLVDYLERYQGLVTRLKTRPDRKNLQFDRATPLAILPKCTKTVCLDRAILPTNSEQLQISSSRRFQLLRALKTLEALQTLRDVIVGGQLYHPELQIWAEYDLLIRHRVIRDARHLPAPNNYLAVKILDRPLTSATTRSVKMELYLAITVLNRFYHTSNSVGLIVDANKRCIWVDYQRETDYRDLFNSGHQWLTDLANQGAEWCPHRPHDTRLMPNLKLRSSCGQVMQIKGDIAAKTGELTQIWSIGTRHRQELFESRYRIRSISDLKHHINKSEVRDILGSKFPVIRNIVLSEKRDKIVNAKTLSRMLAGLPNLDQIYLDFEFNDQHIYLIGFYLRFKTGGIRFQQLVTRSIDCNGERELLASFASALRELTHMGSQKLLCFHWGQVEAQLINKKCPHLSGYLHFTDLNRMFVQAKVGIPRCYGYGLKSVAKSLKQQGLINTEWSEGTDGIWCNRSVSELVARNTGDVLAECPGMSEIFEYNRVDCRVMVDIVDLFKGACCPL